MAAADRYEITEKIAQGDFATVFRARDHELSREVAIKQIHQQFLADPRQLDRYWQEAQLLASLEHPHIMTIYDVVRERGWLILELAQGSLQQLLGGNPIDLKDLRLAMVYSLRALEFMHQHGIVHGDVKPSNLLVDRNNRVKLGDFGIARHMASGDGSVVKGTTKYMAPEVVSDQFGEVGPHSDLYSLGFTAYELMCGEHFDSLFPGLDMYGRDRQIAWMMWHSAPDRRLPEIQRVLEGVPPDLVHVIHRLAEKDPSQRYRTAPQVLTDLEREGEVVPPGPTEEELAAAEAEQRQSQRRRNLVMAAAACSLVLSLGMLFLPGGGTDTVNPATPVRPRDGVIVEIDAEFRRIFVAAESGGSAIGVTIDPANDRVRLNETRVDLAALRTGDAVQIRYLTTDDGGAFKEVDATRELAVADRGTVAAIDPYVKTLTVEWADQVDLAGDVFVGDSVPITLNGSTELDQRRVRLNDLKADDRVTIEHRSGNDGRREAQSITALRVSLGGFVMDAAGPLIQVRIARQWDAADANETTFSVAADCDITLNGKPTTDGRPLRITDLRPRDSISIRHDAEVHRIEAYRDVSTSGAIADIQHAARTFSIRVDDNNQQLAYRADPDCRIEIEGEPQEVEFGYLRQADRITVQRKSPDPENREAVLITVAAEADPRSWAILIGHDKYDNPQLPTIPFAAKDIEAVREALRVNYRVPADQMIVEHNATRLRLENSIPPFLARIPASAQLVVYFLGHGYLDQLGQPYLVPQGFDERRVKTTGLSLDWLIGEMEGAEAREKLLLLDTTHESESPLPETYPAAAEVAAAAKDGPNRPVSTSVTVVASCQAGQQSLKSQEQQRGLFSRLTVDALSGAADRNGDHRISGQELFGYLADMLTRHSSQSTQSQTPVLFLPDATPPRLSDDAKSAIRAILVYLQRRPDERLPIMFQRAKQLAGDQPEADLAFGLVELKDARTVAAFRAFDGVRLSHPDALLAYHALAWQHYMRAEYQDGVNQLEELVRRLPAEPTGAAQRYAEHLLEFAGKMAAYARVVDDNGRRLAADDIAALNDAVRRRGSQAMDLYRQGYGTVFEQSQQLQEDIDDAFSEVEKKSLQRDLTRLTYYLDFDYDRAEAYLTEQLEL